MSEFKPTTEQQKFIEMAEGRFDTWLAQPKRPANPFSRYFLEKCSSELGIRSPHKPRGHVRRGKLFAALEGIFSHDSWLCRLFRRR